MRLLVKHVLILPLVAGVMTARGEDCLGDQYRISAIVQSSERVLVGIVEPATGQGALIQPGGSFGDLRIIAADYATETVVCEIHDVECTVHLRGDPNLTIADLNTVTNIEASLANFLREFPEALESGLIELPLLTPGPAVTGMGPGIEALLAQHPEYRPIASITSPPGLGPGIEALMREQGNEPVAPEPLPPGSMGPGIESALEQLDGDVDDSLQFTPPDPSAPR